MDIKDIVNIDPAIMSGTPVFRGTRVPIQTLIDWLASNYTLDEWLDAFPSVPRELAQAYLRLAHEQLLNHIETAA